MVTAPNTDRPVDDVRHFGLVGLNIVAVLLGSVGVIVALLSFVAGDHATADDPASRPVVGEAVETTFGSIVVEHFETLDGLTDEELGGMSHGISDLVEQNDAQVSVAVLLSNRSDHPIAVGPGDYALFVDGAPDAVPPSSSTIQPLDLAPGSSVDLTVTFVVPRTGAAISMGYADPGGPTIVVPVGRLDQAPPSTPTDNQTTATDHHGDDGH